MLLSFAYSFLHYYCTFSRKISSDCFTFAYCTHWRYSRKWFRYITDWSTILQRGRLSVHQQTLRVEFLDCFETCNRRGCSSVLFCFPQWTPTQPFKLYSTPRAQGDEGWVLDNSARTLSCPSVRYWGGFSRALVFVVGVSRFQRGWRKIDPNHLPSAAEQRRRQKRFQWYGKTTLQPTLPITSCFVSYCILSMTVYLFHTRGFPSCRIYALIYTTLTVRTLCLSNTNSSPSFL